MKKLLYFVAFIGALVLNQSAQAVGPLLSGLYNSVSNQLYVVSNTPPVDTKLAKSLNAALSAIQKSGGGPDVTSAIKGLGSVVKIVNRTSVSNALAASVHSTLVDCANQYLGVASTYSNQVAGYISSPAQTATFDAISALLTSIDNIGNNPDANAALKALTGLSKQVKTIQKDTSKAEKAKAPPAPPAGVSATATISGKSANFKSNAQTAQQTTSGNFIINAAQGGASGLQSIAFTVLGLTPGANSNVVIHDGEYTKVSPDASAGAFPATSGTAQVNWDSANKRISGSFTMNLREQGGSRTGTVTGTFSLSYP